MTGAARAGWLLSALFFATILSSIVHVAHVGILADVLLLLLVVVSAMRPEAGMIVLAATVPVAWYVATHWANWASGVGWAETITCAVIAGVSLNASFRPNRSFRLKAEATGVGVKAEAAGFERGEPLGRPPSPRLRRPGIPLSVSAPAVLFGGIVIASLIAGLGVLALRLGPGFTHAIATQLTHEYFIDIKGFPAVHAGTLLLEGVLLFAVAARIAAERAGEQRFLHRVAIATAASATLAAVLNLDKLARSAWRGESFLASLIDLAEKVRWNVHYPDMNAAGSYFAMAAFVAAALAVRARGPRRIAWAVSAIVIAAALWLTSSRIAVLAGLIAPGAVLLVIEISRGRTRALRAAAVTAGTLVLLVLVAVLLPQRGNQKSPLLSADVRVGLLQTGGRMIASRPVFGIGLGQFYQRTAEFSTPDLLAKFPAVAGGENAHNNFMQVAAELGVAGGALFLFLVLVALATIARRAASAPDILMLAGLGAFVLTWLGGHPLLIPEPGYAFWTLLGAATGSATAPGGTRSRLRWIVAIGLIVIAATLPWRLRATTQDADLEHVAVGLSPVWQVSQDGIRYKEGVGHATLFVPTGGFLVSVYPLTDQPVRLELRLDGSVADVVTLAPRHWNDLRQPARTEATKARFAALSLRVLDADQTAIWITKVQPLGGR
jgi:O-antigen ligase